jgi:hypothetical protein
MASSVAAATQRIDETGAEGDLAGVEREGLPDVDADDAGPEVQMPDGSVIYMPRVFGERVDDITLNLLDFKDPARSLFVRFTGLPGTGKSRIARAVALAAWERRGRKVQKRDGQPFYGFVEMSGGPSSDEHTFRHEYTPAKDTGEIKLIDSAFVQAMREGWIVMIDEPNTIRDVALLSLNSVFDGRLSLYLPALAQTVVAQPGFGCLLAYNPGMTSAISDLPQAWYSRFPACLEVTSNWPGLVRGGVPKLLVRAAMKADQDRQKENSGMLWSPQYREVESLHKMMERCTERLGIALFASSLAEMEQTGQISTGELEAAMKILDDGGYERYKSSAATRTNTAGYLRAVTAG